MWSKDTEPSINTWFWTLLELFSKVIFADYVSSIGAFSAKPEASKIPVLFMSNSNSEKESKKKAPYGGIFEKYNN